MLDFSNVPGTLFSRLGKIGKVLSQQDLDQYNQQNNLIVGTGLVSLYDGEPDVQALIGSSYINLLNSTTYDSFLQGLAAATLNRMIFRDNPQLQQNLTTANTLTSLLELIRQMTAQVQSVATLTVTGTPGTFTGTGTGVVVFSSKRALDGKVMEYSLTENVKVVCTADSYTGGATLNNESLRITGVGAQPNPFAFDWPLGSDASIDVQAIDGGSDNSSGNLLTNSDFDSWTGNVPDNWVLQAGTAGTDVIEETALTYDTSSNKSLKLVGDGTASNFWLRQLFGDTTGTLGTLDPDTQYACNLWARGDGSVIASGVLRVSLCDSGGGVIKDNNGVDNSFDVDLTDLSTPWIPVNGSFRTPHIMPSSYYLDLRLTTAFESGKWAYLDRLAFGLMTQHYTGGPSYASFSGNVPFVVNDYATVDVESEFSSGGTRDAWGILLYRLFPEIATYELLIPSSGSPTIDNSWIA